jgi:photosystem II stability/assembly factor-like uncharacterized protein
VHGAVTTDPEKPKSEFGALKFRSVGPAITGRVDRLAGVPGDPLTYYAAFSQGGVWKSENGGRDWKSVFDDEPTNSIGSIAVAASDPNVLYVGSGEANIRGNVAFGTGIFKSVDAGAHWLQVWKTHGQIGTMAIDPKNAEIAFAAVLGSPFGPGKERGVYRTLDGGKNWQQVLFVDERTGASDVAFDPNNPHILYAGMWQTERQPWTLSSGGPGSGLYRSSDGGESWHRLKGKGLPDGDWGKVGVRVAPSDSRIVYALIEAKNGGLFRSEDAGGKWEHVSGAHVLQQRAWYYTCMTIDPTNANIVWVPQVELLRTIDAGKNWQSIKGPSHGDHHDIWIDPLNPRRVFDGNDGGISLSVDGGASWASPALPTPQFYNIDVDERLPYHVGGTIQDWSTASGPAYVLRSGGGPDLGDFYYVGGGESGDLVFDRAEPGHIYAGGYSGYISHYQENTGNVRNISRFPRNFSGIAAQQAKYRFQWTAPIATSPHDPKILYHGANVLFRSHDRGAHWDVISPDLTRNDKTKQQWTGGPITGDITGVEYYDTIFSIAESSVTAGEIWVGTDDGLVQLTRDAGQSWTNITPPKLPHWATIEFIEPSTRNAGTAYVVGDNHRLDDVHPYLFRTRDYGHSWELLGAGLPEDQHLYVVREDPTDPNLLYVGSERGLFFSRDAGKSFQDLRNNLPAVGVSDIEVKHDDLILGTRRGIWILDDLSALRAFAPAVKSEAVHLFTPRAAHRFRLDVRQDQDREGQADKAPGSPMEMNIAYWLKSERKDLPGAPVRPITLQILDAKGQLVRTLSSVIKPNRYSKDDPDQPEEEAKADLTTDAGLNRVQWDLRYEGAKRLQKAKIDSGDPDEGPLVLPGRYTLRLNVDDKIYTAVGEVLTDPRSPVPLSELEQNVAFTLKARAALERLTDDIEDVRAIRAQTQDLRSRTAPIQGAKELQTAAERVVKSCDTLESRMHNPEAEVVYDVLTGRDGGAKLYSQIAPLFSDMQSSDYAPTQGQLEQMEENLADLQQVEAQLHALRTEDLAGLEAQTKALNLPRVILPDRSE